MLKLLALLRFIRRSTVLVGVGLVGGTVTAAGVVMLVTPGPGLVVIIAGLAILATQFAWAERALDRVKQQAVKARDKASVHRADRRADRADRAALAELAELAEAGEQVGRGERTDRGEVTVPDGPGAETHPGGARATDVDVDADNQATG